jgi:hypothetical protein
MYSRNSKETFAGLFYFSFKNRYLLFSAGGALSVLRRFVSLFGVVALILVMKHRFAVRCVIIRLSVIALASPAVVV